MTDLFPEWRVGAISLTEAPYMVPIDDSVDYGSPENVTEVIRSMFLDGDFEVSSKAGNRTVVLPVLIADSDMAALADAEAALALECDKVRNEVYVDPGDGWAEPFIFDVFRGQLAFSRSDKYEKNGYRAYTLTFRALPYSRSTEATSVTPTPTSVGTARQKSYTFDVTGSARTEAALHVGGSLSGLGWTMIYTRPGAQGMIPLRQHRVSGGAVTTSSAYVSGAYDQDLSTTFVAEVPKADVPDGTYILLALLAISSGTGDTTLTTAITTEVDGYGVKTPSGGDVDLADLSTTYEIRQLGPAFQLPSAIIASDAAGVVKVQIADAASGVTVQLDEAWLVEVGSGALTWPQTSPLGIGADPAAHVWVDPPSVTRPYPRVLRGVASDQSDAFGAEVYSWGAHVLEVGENSAFLVTASDTTAALDLTYWRRWNTHAGF